MTSTLFVDGATIAVFLELTILTILSLRRLLTAQFESKDILITVHSAMACGPIILKWIYGKPFFYAWPGLQLAANDPTTHIIYLALVAAAPLVYLTVGRAPGLDRARLNTHPMKSGVGKQLRLLLHLCLVSTFAYLAFLPNPASYFSYAVLATGDSSGTHTQEFVTLYLLTYLTIVSSSVLILTTHRIALTVCSVMPFVLAASWINGKRNCVMFAIAIVLLAVKLRGRVRPGKFVALTIGLVATYFIYSEWYQAEYRIGSVFDERRAVLAQLDYGREVDVKLAIFAELYDTPILHYRGQSLLFDVLFFVPRSMWPDKPYPYWHYYTAKSLGLPAPPRGYGMTESWLGEAIANLGWLGLLFGPLIPALICRLGDSCRNSVISLLTAMMVTLILTIDLVSFVEFLIAWVISVSVSLGSRALIQKKASRRVGMPLRAFAKQSV